MLAQGSPADILFEAALATTMAPIKEIVARSRLEPLPASQALQELLKNGKLIQMEDGAQTTTSDMLVVALPHWNMLRDRALGLVESYHKDHPLRRGMPREELKSKLKLSARLFNTLMTSFVARQLLLETGKSVSRLGHEVKFDGQEQVQVHTMMRKFAENPFSPPGVKECQSTVGEEAG